MLYRAAPTVLHGLIVVVLRSSAESCNPRRARRSARVSAFGPCPARGA